MKQQSLIIILRQAGSAAAMLPAVEAFYDQELALSTNISMQIIVFPQAMASCEEVSKDIKQLNIYPVSSEYEAHKIFDKHINKASIVFTGTSAEAIEDAYYWREARKHNVTSIAYLDQWSNMDKRFPGKTREDWPDHLAVIDIYDKKLVQAIAPAGVQIHLTGSPALERIKREVDLLRIQGIKADPKRFIFATEPVADPESYRIENGFCDEDSFKLLVSLMRKYHLDVTLVMRLHPLDSKERWQALLPEDIPIEWDADSRVNCLAQAGKVFGMRSFFLLEAFISGVSVFSLQPNKKTYCPLTDERMPVLVDLEDYVCG